MSREEAWKHLYQIAMVELKFTEEEFWNSTPKKLQILMERKYETLKLTIQRENTLTGILAATIANFSMARGDKTYRPSDFVGDCATEEYENDESPEAVQRNFALAFQQMNQPFERAKREHRR